VVGAWGRLANVSAAATAAAAAAATAAADDEADDETHPPLQCVHPSVESGIRQQTGMATYTLLPTGHRPALQA
jgi:hypothetical protein